MYLTGVDVSRKNSSTPVPPATVHMPRTTGSRWQPFAVACRLHRRLVLSSDNKEAAQYEVTKPQCLNFAAIHE